MKINIIFNGTSCLMSSAILIAILSFSHGKYDVSYPMGISPWINSINHVSTGKSDLVFKNKVFGDPKCSWSSLNTDSRAVTAITYYSNEKIAISTFEKKGKKNLNKDIPFILSCREK
jgi:hypothetical protein